MRVFRYWVRREKSVEIGGEEFRGVVYGGSNVSEAEALQEVESRWTRICARIRGEEGEEDEIYESDIREELLEEVAEGAVVTRNRYGAEILNVTDLVIVDVDRSPEPLSRSLLGWFRSFFRGEKPRKKELVEQLAEVMESMIAEKHPILLGGRIYRTPAGARCLLKTTVTDPRNVEVQKLMFELGVDWLYAALCQKQRCYRARLTAKPSRIPMRSLRQKWPVTEEEAAVRAEWVAEYRQKASGLSACRYVASVGEEPDSPLVKWHDEASGAWKGGRLA